MKHRFSAIAASLSLATLSSGEALMPGVEGPNGKQQALIDRGYGMFIHFGVNTFNEVEWSDGMLPVSSYHPTRLDCDQWVRTAKEAGFRYVVLITKHHDGFCLWNSGVTDYDVASSPEKTDVVGEVAKACARHGVKLGLYYSLWDRHEPCYEQHAEYVAFMKSQLTELLTNYGPVCELWLDGGWMKKKDLWDIPGLYELANRLQPDCVMSTNFSIEEPGKPESNLPPEAQQKGDKVRFWPTDFRLLDPLTVRWDDPKVFTRPDGKPVWLPYEHTVCLSDYWNWFQKREDRPARKLDELEELFYWCTAHQNVLVINIPPDQTGRIREHERLRILELADRLGIRGGDKPLPAGPVNQAWHAKAEATSSWSAEYSADKAFDHSLGSRWAARDDDKQASITFSSADGSPFDFDRIAIHEARDTAAKLDNFSSEKISRIRQFAIDAYQNGGWNVIHIGTSIDAASVLNFPDRLQADKLRLRILKAEKGPSIHHISVSRRDTIRPR